MMFIASSVIASFLFSSIRFYLNNKQILAGTWRNVCIFYIRQKRIRQWIHMWHKNLAVHFHWNVAFDDFSNGFWIVTATIFIQFNFSAVLNWLNGNDYDSCQLLTAHSSELRDQGFNDKWEINNGVKCWNIERSNTVVIIWYSAYAFVLLHCRFKLNSKSLWSAFHILIKSRYLLLVFLFICRIK